jgi:hypothetical protein
VDEALKGQIRTFAMGRIGIGAVAVLVPRLVLRPWLGKGNNTPATRMLTRMVGARDIALGMGVVFALNHDAPVRGWLEAATVADGGDFVATLLGFRHLPRLTAIASALSSIGGAAYGRRLVSELAANPAAVAGAAPAPEPATPATADAVGAAATALEPPALP